MTQPPSPNALLTHAPAARLAIQSLHDRPSAACRRRIRHLRGHQ